MSWVQRNKVSSDHVLAKSWCIAKVRFMSTWAKQNPFLFYRLKILYDIVINYIQWSNMVKLFEIIQVACFWIIMFGGHFLLQDDYKSTTRSSNDVWCGLVWYVHSGRPILIHRKSVEKLWIQIQTNSFTGQFSGANPKPCDNDGISITFLDGPFLHDPWLCRLEMWEIFNFKARSVASNINNDLCLHFQMVHSSDP